jgi:argininosuccinate synthase
MEEMVQKIKNLFKDMPEIKKVVLSYSGGLDSIVMGKLLELAGISVVPVVVDIGQKSDFKKIKENAEKLFGSCIIVDAKEEVLEGLLAAVKANFGKDDKITSGGITRAVISSALVKEARKQNCPAIVHGASGAGNDQFCIENSIKVLAPEIRVIALIRDLDLKRDEEIEFAKRLNLPVNLERAEKFSVDESLFGRIIRQGEVLDKFSLPTGAYRWASVPSEASDKPEEIELEFENGIPKKLLIQKKQIENKLEIINMLNEIGGKHSIGITEGLDDKVIGLKIREIYEAPAISILLFAHKKLSELVLTKKELELKQKMDFEWAKLVNEGFWFSRLKLAIDSFIDEIENNVEGKIKIKLYRGNLSLVNIESKKSLYDRRLSARDSTGMFLQKDARYFAKLYGIEETIAYIIKQQK